MKRSILQNAVTGLIIIAVVTIPLTLPASGQGSATTRTTQYYTNQAFQISGTSSGTCHHFEVPMGGVAVGDTIAGSLSSDGGPVTFAIMNMDEAQRLLSSTANTCSGLDSNSRYFKEGQSFQFQWTVTALSAYFLVMVNKNSTPITVTMSAYLITGSPGQFYTPTSNTNYVSSTPYYSATEASTVSPTNTPSSIVSPFVLPFDSTYLVIAVGAIVLVAVILLMRRSSRTRKPIAVQRAPVMDQRTSQVTRKQFCVNCGRQIPFGSKFCGKCGAAQTQA